LGVGEKTIATVCAEQGVDCNTLLAIVNFTINQEVDDNLEIDIDTLNRYLENAHQYFLNFQLPRIRQELLSAINLAENTTKVPLMIIQYFDEYVQEIRSHIEHEKSYSYEQHSYDDKHVATKAHELKNLIIKYYPSHEIQQQATVTYTLISVMSDLWHTELDFADHCAIEDEILRPALTHIQAAPQQHNLPPDCETLSERERDVLVQIVKGLSNKEIADVLCISVHTVITHRKNITRKLNIHSTAGLTIYAIVNQLVDLNSLD
jgi:regulator of cell morphogenesis and NO signaling